MAMRDDLAQSAEEQNIKTIRILRTTQAADVKEMVKEFFRFIGCGGGEKGNPQLLGRQLAPKRHGIRYDPIGGNPFHIPADLLIQGQCGADNQVNGKGQILAHPGAVLRGGRHPQRSIVTGDKGRAGFLNDLLKGREGIVPDLIPPGPHSSRRFVRN